MLKFIGRKHVDYFSQKKNQQVQGIEAYFTYADPDVEGEATMSQYANFGTPLYDNIVSLRIGGSYEPESEFNPRFGNYHTVAFIESTPVNITSDIFGEEKPSKK